MRETRHVGVKNVVTVESSTTIREYTQDEYHSTRDLRIWNVLSFCVQLHTHIHTYIHARTYTRFCYEEEEVKRKGREEDGEGEGGGRKLVSSGRTEFNKLLRDCVPTRSFRLRIESCSQFSLPRKVQSNAYIGISHLSDRALLSLVRQILLIARAYWRINETIIIY